MCWLVSAKMKPVGSQFLVFRQWLSSQIFFIIWVLGAPSAVIMSPRSFLKSALRCKS